MNGALSDWHVHTVLVGGAVVLTLLFTPLVAVVWASTLAKGSAAKRHRVLGVLAGVVAVVASCAVVGLSLSVYALNLACVGLAYLAFGVLALSVFWVRPKAVGVGVGLVLSIPLMVGLFMGTCGVIGVMLIAPDLVPIHVSRNRDAAACHVYSFGNATSSDGGFEVAMTVPVPFVPLLDYRLSRQRFNDPGFSSAEACERARSSLVGSSRET